MAPSKAKLADATSWYWHSKCMQEHCFCANTLSDVHSPHRVEGENTEEGQLHLPSRVAHNVLGVKIFNNDLCHTRFLGGSSISRA